VTDDDDEDEDDDDDDDDNDVVTEFIEMINSAVKNFRST
jgi:hypothetical protein